MTLKERVTVLERSSAQHDKQVKAIRALVQEGMRLLVETRKDLRTLTTNVNRLVSSLRPTNGHAERKIDLQ